ncbi:MAG TPA: hypothetical protein VE088_06565 [Gaiellaceae bacterium]|jgi:hypothetical protein|nr:hypothetical protein [Gaiellaceae bacterium]
MRLLRIGLLAVAVAPFAAAAGTRAALPSGTCAPPATVVAPSLPAAVTVRTSCGAFRIGRDGRVERISPDPQPVPRGTGWWPSTGVWARTVRGRLVVGRWRRTLWHSSRRYPRDGDVGGIVLDGDIVAFSYGSRASRLYVARLGGRERLVARGEIPLGRTRDGFYTRRVRGGRLLLRRSDGSLHAPIAHGVGTYATGPAGTLLFVAHDGLFRARGAHVYRIADLSRLGLTAGRAFRLLTLGHLIGLENAHRLVVLRADGTLFARTVLPFARNRIEFVSGGPAAGDRAAAVAFAVIRGDRAGDGQVMQRGVETIYLLRSGSRVALPVHAMRTWFDVCGHAADLSWHGDWLLYRATGGSTALIDTGSGRTIGLSSIVRRLPGFTAGGTGFFGASWS